MRARRLDGTFRSLRSRNYRLYATGSIVSASGTWMQRIAQDWLVLDLTGNSGGALGIVTTLQFIPLLMFGLWGGVLADRFAKRRVIMATQAALGMLALILGAFAVTGTVRIWHVYVLAFALGVVTLFDNPTRQSFIVELVEPADRANAIVLQGAAETAARIVGPALAGTLIELIGAGPVFLINGVSAAGVILALKLMREEELRAAPRTTRAGTEIRAGFAYLRERRDLVLLLVLVAFVAAFGMNPQITTALMIRGAFHGGAGSYGLASTTLALGSLAGALLTARRAEPTIRVMLGAVLLFGAVEAGSALLPTYAWFAAALFPTGFVLIVFNNATLTKIQLEVAPEMRGRITGIYAMVFAGTTPIGAPVIGWMAQLLGPRSGLLAAGAITIVATAATAPALVHAINRVRAASLRERHERNHLNQ